MSEQAPFDRDHEKWLQEYDLRRREIEIKEREANRNRWSAPLVIAIFTAAAAGLGNATAVVLNGIEQRSLEATEFDQARGIEETKAEAARIFEVIKTGNPDQAAKNLKFLVDVGLISDPGRIKSIKALDLEGNQLPALPPIISQPPINWDEPQPIGRPPKPGGKSKEVR